VKSLLHPSFHGRSGYLALFAFGLIYGAALALVIAPEQIMAAANAVWVAPFE
jgi:hypothetical protein